MTTVANLSVAQTLRTLIEKRTLEPLFQPIIDTFAGKIIGHEALIRGPKGHSLEFPNDLFRVAAEHHMLSELELACRDASLRRYQALAMPGRLFLNVNPNVLLEKHHPQGSTLKMAEQLGIAPEKIVIELSEQYPVQDAKLLQYAIERYRDEGFAIAIDDLGSGYSGLKLWSELKPDYVKIDRYFISNIHQDPVKREFVQSIVALGRNMQSRVVAEGIESEDELQQLHALGVHYCQGFYLGRPAAQPLQQVDIRLLQDIRRTRHLRKEPVGNLLEQTITVNSRARADAVLDMFLQDTNLLSIPVIDDSYPVGMIRREKLLELFSGSYGRALYANKAIDRIMDNNPLVVDKNTPIEQVSHMITDDYEVDIYRQFIITKQRRYVGVASVRNLLRKITEARVQNARYANPLTLLPGNVPIYRAIDEALQSGRHFAVAYFDLNHFKPYNDVYGYAQGDRVIQWVAQLLQDGLVQQGQFVGHVGGDDFVVIFEDDSVWQQQCELILQRFHADIGSFYNSKDRERGGIEAVDRNGASSFYPLLGIAVGVVLPAQHACHSHHDVAALASAAKKLAKQQDSHLFCLVPEASNSMNSVSADQGRHPAPNV
ncbi:GGDEF domain-containing protein [Idiomarina xiamenensis]|uniref:Signal protein n=1 Tax=Idiomarina xiamenensis 10-D-4 TaxID=740709 RepID=K2KCX2_9GAMM|nr:GGDEF domain-containing protein [Idiomarina xiamenensis]EKE84542.1 signal protein [Idiomarina xiamenensis 10-D-4]